MNYTLDNSPCSCIVADPDGFLSRMTFNLTVSDISDKSIKIIPLSILYLLYIKYWITEL